MAHNIAEINGQNAIAYIDGTPWHGMGPNILQQMRATPQGQRVDLALELAQLKYTVGSVPMYLADGTEMTGHKASVRFNPDGTIAAVFGPVGDGYTHTQNDRNVDILRALEQFGAVPAVAGALGQGQRAWMLMRMADSKITPIDGDDVNGYFLLHWGHDGNVSIQGLFTGIRVVCQNTLSMATSGRKAWINVRHTASADARIDEAAKLVERITAEMVATGQTFAGMARKALTADQLQNYIARAIPDTGSKATVSPIIVARRDTVAKLVFYGRGAAMANQAVNTADGSASLWAAYNAVTEYFDHVRTAEAQSDSGLRRAQESAVFGGNAEIKAAALQEAQRLLAA
jgi:phage/plasmid-like protein (TIGR03299 family)